MEDIFEQFIHDAMDKMNLKISEEDRKTFEEVMIKIFKEGKKPQEVLGFNDEMIEHMYYYGYRLYNNGNYKKAKNVFKGVLAIVPDEKRFLLALAACHHRLKEYSQAVENYYQMAMWDPEDPIPFYYMYDCYYRTGFLSDAGICLAEVVRRCGENPLYANIKERCKLMYTNLEKEVEKLKKEGKIIIEDVPIKEEPDIGIELPQTNVSTKKPSEKPAKNR